MSNHHTRYIASIYRAIRSVRPLAAPWGVMDNSRTLTLFRGENTADRGSGQAGHVDYSLARKATLRDLKRGRISRMDVCDAHPDLLRAARYSGEQTSDACPICEYGVLVLVKYAFSDGLSKSENGMVWTSPDVGPLLKLKEARIYTVEVCPSCSWNHLRSQLMLTGRGSGRGRRASTT